MATLKSSVDTKTGRLGHWSVIVTACFKVNQYKDIQRQRKT